MGKTTLKIKGMHCSSCEKLISLALEDVENVKLISISAPDGKAVVEAKDTASLEMAKKTIKGEGYEVA